ADGIGDGESDDDAENAADEGDEDGLGEELEADFAVSGSHGFADADLANAGADGGEHDIHDADAANQKNDQRHCEQNGGHGGSDAVHHGQHRREILHVVNGFGAVARLDDAFNLRGGCDHHGGICHGEVGQTDGGSLHEIAGDRVRDQHRVVFYLRLAESFDALLEGSNHGEWQSGQLDDLANRSCRRTVDLDRHPFRDQGNFVVSQGIVVVEEAAGGDDQVAHAQILRSDPENGDIFFLAAAGGDSVRQSDDRRGCDDAGHLLLYGRKVFNGQRVRGGTADVLRAALILGPDLVRADGLNLVERVLASGHADGDHQDERSSANDHPGGHHRHD